MLVCNVRSLTDFLEGSQLDYPHQSLPNYDKKSACLSRAMNGPCRLGETIVLLLYSQIAFRQLCIKYRRTSLNKISDKHLRRIFVI